MIDFVVYSEGLCYASVCTSLSDADTANRMGPAGTQRGWRISDEPSFADGTPNGAACPFHVATHRHILFEC